MRMRSTLFLLVVVTALLSGEVVFGSDCAGGWSKIAHYNGAAGPPCVQLGFDSHSGVCLPGQPFEILCDDASKGRYRICLGHNRCVGPQAVQKNTNSKNQVCIWDFATNRLCSPGFLNVDCRDSCETALPLAP